VAVVTRITWKEREFSGFAGRAGGVQLFSVTRRSRRWILQTTLPGLRYRTWDSDDCGVLYGRAEEILDEWLSRVGGTVTTG
jgi:hypothetical protein